MSNEVGYTNLVMLKRKNEQIGRIYQADSKKERKCCLIM